MSEDGQGKALLTVAQPEFPGTAGAVEHVIVASTQAVIT